MKVIKVTSKYLNMNTSKVLSRMKNQKISLLEVYHHPLKRSTKFFLSEKDFLLRHSENSPAGFYMKKTDDIFLRWQLRERTFAFTDIDLGK